MSRTNYYANDIALQQRMAAVMQQLIHQYPYTHQGTFGGFAVENEPRGYAGMGSSGGSSGGRKRGGRKVARHASDMLRQIEGGESRGMERPTGKRGTIPGRYDYGGIVEGDEMYTHPMLGRDKSTWSPFPLKHKGRGKRAAGYSGGISGGRGGNSKWIKHVKAYAKKHRISYGEAMSAARSSYHG